jgi:two-component system sensor histidine kinase/response regulator
MAPCAHEKGLELAFRIAPGVNPYLLGDPTRLRQILINLLGNAVKFTTRGEVVIEVAGLAGPADRETLRFNVRDTGIGIALDQQAAVFDSFSQADVSITRKYGGSGLGLAICKRLVALMGGRIGLNSAPGQGSEFFFMATFERAATIPESWGMPEAEAQRALQNQRVLIVDDTAANRLLVHDYLRMWGAQVGMAENGGRALEEIERAERQKQPYHLVLMDMQMPEMDGLQTVRLIRERHPAPPPAVVVLTSSELPSHRSQLEALNIQGYLAKPVRRADLFDALLTALGKSIALPEPRSLRTGLSPLPAARLLLVEDIAANRKVIQKFLQDSAVTLVEAVNGREAVDKAMAEPFDLILMDVEMPEMDGLEATRRIRAWEAHAGTPPVPIVTLTAHAFNEHRQQCQEAGGSAFLAKPVRKVELLRLLGEWLTPPSLVPPMPSPETPSRLAGRGEGGADAPERELLPPIKVRVDEFLEDLLPEFLDELTGARVNMRQAMASGDFGDLRRLAHGYKGAAGSYELPTLAQILLGLEQAALSGDASAAAASLAEIDDYLRRLEVEYV